MLVWGRLTDLINRGKRLKTDSAFFFVFSQKDIQLFAIELNTGGPNIQDYGQLFLHGIDAEGVKLSEIGGEYADFTKDIKEFEGLPIDRVTLYQEGDFYQSWQFIQTNDGFQFRADTMKDGEDLQARWGSNILGLSNESINKLATEAAPRLIEYILRELLQGS